MFLTISQFEWTWQHPTLSKHVRHHLAAIMQQQVPAMDTALLTDRLLNASPAQQRQINYRLCVLSYLLHLPKYARYSLELLLHTSDSPTITSVSISNLFYGSVGKGRSAQKWPLAPLPRWVSMSTFSGEPPAHSGDFELDHEYAQEQKVDNATCKTVNECTICWEILDQPVETRFQCLACQSQTHLECLAEWFLYREQPWVSMSSHEEKFNHPASMPTIPHLLPVHGTCPSCLYRYRWSDVVLACLNRGTETHDQEVLSKDANLNHNDSSSSEDSIEFLFEHDHHCPEESEDEQQLVPGPSLLFKS